MTLNAARPGQEYIIRSIHTGDRELEDFLFSLGCFPGQPITIVSRRWSSSTVAIKDARYSIDRHLAEAIRV